MLRNRRDVFGAVRSALLLGLAACGGSEANWVVPTSAEERVGTPIHITGKVQFYGIEGGFYAIRGDDEVTYDPTNLPTAFRKDGLAVEADARLLEGVGNSHMAGPIVELERIRTR